MKRFIIVLLILVGCNVMGSDNPSVIFTTEQTHYYNITETSFGICNINNTCHYLPTFSENDKINISYAYSRNSVSYDGECAKSIILSHFTPFEKNGHTYYYYIISGGNLPPWIRHQDDIRFYWINETITGNGTIYEEIDFNNSCYGIHRIDRKIAFYVDASCNVPANVFYFSSNSYIINLTGEGGNTLQNYTGNASWDYCLLEVTPNITDDGLVMYQSLDCNDAVDVFGQVNGTIEGNPQFTNSGKRGGTFDFDGTGDAISLDSLNAYSIRTIELWFNPAFNITNTTDFGTDNAISLIHRNDATQNNEFGMNIWDSAISAIAGHIAFRVDTSPDRILYSDSDTWTENTWYHAVGIIDPVNGMKLYIDGVLQQDTDASTGAVPSDTEETSIGCWGDSNNRYWNGLIDEVKLYNRALSWAEINASRDARSAIFSQGNWTKEIDIVSGGNCSNITISSGDYYGGNYSLYLNDVFKQTLEISADSSGTYDCSGDSITDDFNLTILLPISSTPQFDGITIEGVEGECTCSTCSECNTKLNDASCSVVKLDSDITNDDGGCIVFPTNDKTFDCQGYTIDGDNDTTGTGILLNAKTGNVIENCIVQQFQVGIKLVDGANSNNLTNNTANYNAAYGIWLDNATNNSLTNNTANYNTNHGILVFNFATFNDLTNNTANYNTNYGITMASNGNNNTITDCTANYNTYGFSFIGTPAGSNNTGNNNSACSNTYDFYNTGTGNTGDDNTGDTFSGWTDTGAYGTTYGCGCNCHSCGNTENCNTQLNNNSCNTILLTQNTESDYSTTCINDPANFTNKTFDCQGYIIDGNGTGFGIYLNDQDNNTIQNCNISEFETGIYLYNSSNNNITNNTANYNENGIYLYTFSYYNTLTNNTANDNTWLGITLSIATYNNNLTNNTANNNGYYGIYLSGSSNNNLTDNTANENTYGGLYIGFSSTGNEINSNTFCSNGDGISYFDIKDLDSNTGDNNNCTTTANWDDTGTIGCTYFCDGNCSDGTMVGVCSNLSTGGIGRPWYCSPPLEQNCSECGCESALVCNFTLYGDYDCHPGCWKLFDSENVTSPEGQCFPQQPWYCENATINNVTENSSYCGCPDGREPLANGSCTSGLCTPCDEINQTVIPGNVYIFTICNTSEYTCPRCNLVGGKPLARNYTACTITINASKTLIWGEYPPKDIPEAMLYYGTPAAILLALYYAYYRRRRSHHN